MEDTAYKLLKSGNDTGTGGVCVPLSKELPVKKFLRCCRLFIRITIGVMVFAGVNVYFHRAKLRETAKDCFYQLHVQQSPLAD